jgi:CO dehydrogenase/acetyl-CoA synthase gamma subunit (corrinoid Fe-S protein)
LRQHVAVDVRELQAVTRACAECGLTDVMREAETLIDRDAQPAS